MRALWVRPEIDEMWMIEPRVFSKWGSAAYEARTEAMRSTLMLAIQPASSSLAPNPEALLTSTSMPPSACAAAAT